MIPVAQHQCMNRGIDAEPSGTSSPSLPEFCDTGRIVGRISATDTEMAVVGSSSTLLPEESTIFAQGEAADRSPVAPWRNATLPELPSFEPEAKLQESPSPESSRGTDVSPKKASRRPSTANSRSPRVSKARSRVLPRRSSRSSNKRGSFTRFFSSKRGNLTVSVKKDLPSSEAQQELEDFTGETVLEDCALSSAGDQADFDFVLENVPAEFTNCHRQSLQLRHIHMYAAQGSHRSLKSGSDRSFLSSLTSIFSSLTRSGSSSFLVHDDEEYNWNSSDSPHSSSERDLTRCPAHSEDIIDFVPRRPWRRGSCSCGSSTARRMLSISKIDEKGEDGIYSSSDEEASKTGEPEQAEPVKNEDVDESIEEALEGISSSSNLLEEKPNLNLAHKGKNMSCFRNLRRCSDPETRVTVVPKAKNVRCQSAPVCASRRETDLEPQPETELPYPVRRESFMTVDSRRRQTTNVPNSVSPEATILEKKSFLKKKLLFPKQRLRKALTRAINSGETFSPAKMRSNSEM